MTRGRSRSGSGGTRADGALQRLLGHRERRGHSNCRGRICGHDGLRLWDRFGHGISDDHGLRGCIRFFELLRSKTPPTQALGIIPLQLLQQRLETIHTVAMGPLAKQPIHSNSVSLG